MKTSLWRQGIKAFLLKYLSVSTWELDYPIQAGETVGILPPITNVNIYKNGATVMQSATQVVELISRIDGTLRYDNLPISFYEGIHTTLSYRLLTEFADIADIFQLQLQSLNPISIAERDDARGDWFIRVQWSMSVQWVAELEVGTPGLPFNFTQILVGIKRALPPRKDIVDDIIAPARNILDTTLTINRIP